MTDAAPISIQLNDPADDDAFHTWHMVFAAASSYDRGPDAPVWSEAELSAELRTQRRSSSTEIYLVHDAAEADSSGGAVGAIALTIPLSDNLHRVDAGLYVVPGFRRRGTGSAMLEFVRSRTRELDRRLIASEVFRPYNNGEAEAGTATVEEEARTAAAPGIAFADCHGVTFAIGDLRSECPLPLDPALVREITEEAQPFHEGFELRSWSGDVPEEFIDQWALMEGLIETEAPTGERDVEPEDTSAADIREQEAIFRAQGRTSFAAIALHSTGEIAAYTQLVHSSAESMVYQ